MYAQTSTKPSKSEYWKNYYTSHLEERRAQARAYYARNQEACIARSKAYIEANRLKRLVYYKEYYIANRKRIEAQHEDWRKAHPLKIRYYYKRYIETHRDKQLEYQRTYYTTHHEKLIIYRRIHKNTILATQRIIGARYQARKRNLKATLTKEQWVAIIKAYKSRCAYCGIKSTKLTQDHVIPVSKGGSYTPDNIVPACLPCNSRKRDHDATKIPSIRLLI